LKTDARVVEALRSLFASGTEIPPHGENCPPAEKIWDAVREELDPGERREIVGHLKSCASCAAEWRSAMEPEEMAERIATTLPARPLLLRTLWLPVAAVAILVLGATLVFILQQRGGVEDRPGYRAGEEERIRSLIPDGQILPRHRFLLRWSAIDEDARYTIKVDRRDLTPVTAARNLLGTEHQVPSEALAEIPSGATIVWRVEARLVDGRKVISEAFLVRLE
jgi:hypothetical protein